MLEPDRKAAMGATMLIQAYYQANLEASSLSADFVVFLKATLAQVSPSLDVMDLINDVEARFNEAGGVQMPDGSQHEVRTFL